MRNGPANSYRRSGCFTQPATAVALAAVAAAAIAVAAASQPLAAAIFVTAAVAIAGRGVQQLYTAGRRL